MTPKLDRLAILADYLETVVPTNHLGSANYTLPSREVEDVHYVVRNSGD